MEMAIFLQHWFEYHSTNKEFMVCSSHNNQTVKNDDVDFGFNMIATCISSINIFKEGMNSPVTAEG